MTKSDVATNHGTEGHKPKKTDASRLQDKYCHIYNTGQHSIIPVPYIHNTSTDGYVTFISVMPAQGEHLCAPEGVSRTVGVGTFPLWFFLF